MKVLKKLSFIRTTFQYLWSKFTSFTNRHLQFFKTKSTKTKANSIIERKWQKIIKFQLCDISDEPEKQNNRPNNKKRVKRIVRIKRRNQSKLNHLLFLNKDDEEISSIANKNHSNRSLAFSSVKNLVHELKEQKKKPRLSKPMNFKNSNEAIRGSANNKSQKRGPSENLIMNENIPDEQENNDTEKRFNNIIFDSESSTPIKPKIEDPFFPQFENSKKNFKKRITNKNTLWMKWIKDNDLKRKNMKL